MTQHSVGRLYRYSHANPPHTRAYLIPVLDKLLAARSWPDGARALDYGCGNGWLTEHLGERGFESFGVDPSPSAIEQARAHRPSSTFSEDVSPEALQAMSPFDLIVSLEVIAHCYEPRAVLATLKQVLKPGGALILSTPYHGYLKNLALAVSGRLERHLDTRWRGAFVHYFHVKSMSDLLAEAEFENISVHYAGRLPAFAKSMVFRCDVGDNASPSGAADNHD